VCNFDFVFECVCLYTYIHVCVYTCTYVHIYICHIYVLTYICGNLYVCVYLYIYLFLCTQIYIDIFVCIEIYMHICVYVSTYGVATISRFLLIIGLFCRIQALLSGSFAKENFNLKEPTNHIHPMYGYMHICMHTYIYTRKYMYIQTHIHV